MTASNPAAGREQASLPVFDDASMSWSQPDVVQTTRGLLPAAAMERVVGACEDAHEWHAFVEYRLGGELVHRSARTHIKQGLGVAGAAAALG
jgi:hypothetical protein